MDRVLLGKSLPESLALFDKGIPPSSSESIDIGINSLFRDLRSGEFRERTGDTAHGWNTEPATRWTSDTDSNNPRKLGRTNETGTLSRADERESEEPGYEEIHGLVEQNKRSETHSSLIQYLLQQNRFGTGEDETIEREEDVRRHVGGMPLLTDLSLGMRTDPLALIRGVTEFVTVIYGPAVTFAFPDVKVEAYRRSVLHLNLISAVDGSTLNWCEQHTLRELMSEDLLFAKISEPEMTVINFDDHFRNRMGEVERGHIEVFPKLWNLRPYDKTNGEVTRVSRLTAAYHKVREETKDWGDYKKLPEAIPEFLLIRRMLLGAVSVVQTPRLRAFETNERRLGNFVGTMDPYFVGRNAAVLQYTRFAYTDQATRRRISNAATPKPGRFDEEWKGLGLAPMRMRGRTELPKASLILTSVKKEMKVGGILQTRTFLAPFGCEEIKVVHGEEEDKSAGTLLIPRFPEGADNDEQGPSSSSKDMSEGDDGQGGSRQTEEPMQQDADQAGGEDDRASTGGTSSLDFNIFSDLENNADTLERTEPADEGISTLEPPSAFMEMKRNLPESSSPGNSRKITTRESSWNHLGGEE